MCVGEKWREKVFAALKTATKTLHFESAVKTTSHGGESGRFSRHGSVYDNRYTDSSQTYVNNTERQTYMWICQSIKPNKWKCSYYFYPVPDVCIWKKDKGFETVPVNSVNQQILYSWNGCSVIICLKTVQRGGEQTRLQCLQKKK